MEGGNLKRKGAPHTDQNRKTFTSSATNDIPQNTQNRIRPGTTLSSRPNLYQNLRPKLPVSQNSNTYTNYNANTNTVTERNHFSSIRPLLISF